MNILMTALALAVASASAAASLNEKLNSVKIMFFSNLIKKDVMLLGKHEAV